MPLQNRLSRFSVGHASNEDLRKQVLTRSPRLSRQPSAPRTRRDPRVPASDIHPALRTYREALSVKPVMDVLDAETKLWDLTEIWYQILKLHFAPEDGYTISPHPESAIPETPESYGLHAMSASGPEAEGTGTFFVIVCSTAVHHDNSMTRVRAAAELRKMLADVDRRRSTSGQSSRLRGAVAVGNSVQFFNWGEDGVLSVYPWGTHPWDISRDHIAVQGCLDVLVDGLPFL